MYVLMNYQRDPLISSGRILTSPSESACDKLTQCTAAARSDGLQIKGANKGHTQTRRTISTHRRVGCTYDVFILLLDK